MDIFAQAARTLAALAGLGSDFAGSGLGSGAFNAKDLAGTVTSVTGDFGALAANLGHDWFFKNGFNSLTDMEKATVKIGHSGLGDESKAAQYQRAVSAILWSITIVETLELTTGFGQADEGDDLRAGSQLFTELSAQLNSALPEDSWQGAASQAYADLDTKLQTIAQALATIDTQSASYVKDHADQVTHMRLGFGILKDVLLVAYAIEVAMSLAVPPVGVVKAKYFAYLAAGLGVAAAVSFLLVLNKSSADATAKADASALQYSEHAAALVQSGAELKVATVGQPVVSRLEAVPASASGFSALSAPRAVASMAAAPSTTDELPSVLSALSSEAETAKDPTAEPVLSADDTIPALTLPTMTQLTAFSGQTAKLSGHLSQHLNLVNQVMGQVQQLVSLAQQSQPAPPPEPAADDAKDPAAAGPSSTAAQRAPIDAAYAPGLQTSSL